MSPLAHLLGSWTIGAHLTDNSRDCRLVALAGILPDADGMGLIVDLFNHATGHKSLYYSHYHHYLLHGALGAFLIAGLLTLFARHRWRVLILCLFVFHLHLLCDFVGSRGPSPEELWPVVYYGPFAKDPMWIWKGQWRLDAWPLRWATAVLFFYSTWLGAAKGYSFVGVINRRADEIYLAVIRKWLAAWKSRRGLTPAP